MSDHENPTVESKCRFLRQQLSALGYDQEFSVGSLPLLENLVSDLLQTTDTLKHYKELSQDCLQACHDLETFVDSYKKDNAWLVRELNTLNLNVILEKNAYEQRISELERNQKPVEDVRPDSTSASTTRHRLCQKTNYERPTSSCSRSEPFKASCKSLREKCSQFEDTIKNKDTEIQQLYSEIFRLNNLLSEGRPVDAVLKDTNDDYSNELFEMRQRNAELQRNLNEAILSSHEAKCNALKAAGRLPQQMCGCFVIDQEAKSVKDKPDSSKEKLKQIEEELENLKLKYQKLELVSKSPEKSAESPRNKLASEVVRLKESVERLENEKVGLQRDLQEIQSAHDDLKQLKAKVDRELSELKRLHQESESDRAEKEKTLKKCLDNKRLLVNRVQELSIIERDLTLEITRLCNINAVHKRHILELETKLLDVYQRKGKENLVSELLITKKPLEKRNIKSTTACKRSKSPGEADSKISEGKSLNVVSRIREKYNQQIDTIQEEQRNMDLSEFNLGLGTSNLKPEVVSFTDEIKLLNNKVDSLKNILLEKEKLISNLQTERQELNNTLNEVTSTLKKTHECDHCKLAEKMIAEYKEKLLKLEVEKRELQQAQADYQRTIDCNNQHIMQLRTELHELQMELQQHKTDSNRFSKLEDETNFSIQSSKVLQKQLEIQLESTMKQLRLMEKETSKAKSDLLSLRDENLKLQRMVMDLESDKEKLSTLSAEKSKKLSTLEKTLKSKEYKLTNLEDVINDFKKQLSSNGTQTDSSRKSTNVEPLRTQIRNLEKARDQAIAENKQLKRDLNSLTQDYLSCKKELDNSRKETQDLNVQVHDYIAKVRAAEETLQQKDKERSEMLEHFRTLTVEATQLGSNNVTLESEARSTRNSLRSAESKIANLESEIESKDRLVSSYLEQIDVLTKNIARLETQVSNLTDQRDRLQAELDSCEMMCGRAEKHEAGKSSGKELGNELYRLHAESERLQTNLSKEKSNVTALEHMLSESRDGMERNVPMDELHDEIRGLKANIKCLQEALESTNRQLRHTQSEASDYQRQIIQLNRDLRNLQFENLRRTADHSLK